MCRLQDSLALCSRLLKGGPLQALSCCLEALPWLKSLGDEQDAYIYIYIYLIYTHIYILYYICIYIHTHIYIYILHTHVIIKPKSLIQNPDLES